VFQRCQAARQISWCAAVSLPHTDVPMNEFSARGVQSIIDDWLPAAGIELSSESIDLRVGEPPPSCDERQPAFQADAEIRAGPPTGDVRMTWNTAPAEAKIEKGSLRAEVVLSEAACERLPLCLDTFMMLVVVMLLRRRGWHHVHGATLVDPRDRGWLITGNSHSGKSTTAALLARSGWTVGTDDAAFLHAGDGHVAVRGVASSDRVTGRRRGDVVRNGGTAPRATEQDDVRCGRTRRPLGERGAA
jgi:hypothetical protein